MTLRNNSNNTKKKKKVAGYNLKLSKTVEIFLRAQSSLLSSNMPLKAYNKYASTTGFMPWLG